MNCDGSTKRHRFGFDAFSRFSSSWNILSASLFPWVFVVAIISFVISTSSFQRYKGVRTSL